MPSPPPLQGTVAIPGDKSISHRVLMLSALASGRSTLRNVFYNADVAATRDCLRQLGVGIEEVSPAETRVIGRGLLEAPENVLDCRNSGTSMRLLAGILAAQPFGSVLTGDASLCRRPMQRIITPLNRMGGRIGSLLEEGFAPLAIEPATDGLHGIAYELPMASAQVKSALLLAGLYAQGETRLREPGHSRDHTERLLRHLGVTLHTADGALILPGGQIETLPAGTLSVPGDPSSAAFFAVAALCIPGSCIRMPGICLNPGRIGLFEALKRVGADIRYENERLEAGEPVGDVVVQASALKGDLVITAAEVPALIDEIPLLIAAGLFLTGTLTITGAEELRHKESDRLAAMASELGKLGAPVEVLPDGLILSGPLAENLHAPVQPLESHHDHRVAMVLATLNRIMDPERWPLQGAAWMDVSFPGFEQVMFA